MELITLHSHEKEAPMLRIGVVVPQEILADIIQFIEKEFINITPVPFPYKAIMDIPDILAGHQSAVDSFLFLGNTARRYAEKTISHSSEWLTIPRSTSALLRLLFRARVAGYRMRIASDLDNKDFFTLAFREIGYDKKDTYVETLPFFPYNEGLLVKDANKMEKLYREGKVDFCITIFYKVRDILETKGVPVYILQPSYDDIRNGLQRLALSHELHVRHDGQLAAISIHIDMPKETIPGNNEYRLGFERLQVTKEIGRFAHTLRAALIDQPPWDYLLFATPSILENLTASYHRFPLLETVSDRTAFTLSIGIGYSATADEALYRAHRALARAMEQGGNQAFLIGNNLSSRVPMARTDQKTKEERPIDEQFLYLSQKSGVSLRMIAKMYSACQEKEKCRFTASELADFIGVTPRTMNRLLAKLIDHHLAQDVSRQFTGKTGRPSRVIELLFETKRKV